MYLSSVLLCIISIFFQSNQHNISIKAPQIPKGQGFVGVSQWIHFILLSRESAIEWSNRFIAYFGILRYSFPHYHTTVTSHEHLFVSNDCSVDCFFNSIQAKNKAPHYWYFVKLIDWWPVDSLHKVPVMRKKFTHCDDIMQEITSSITYWALSWMIHNRFSTSSYSSIYWEKVIKFEINFNVLSLGHALLSMLKSMSVFFNPC